MKGIARSDTKGDLVDLRWVVFQLVERCNLRCRMCYEWGSAGSYHAKRELHELDYEVFERVARECLPARPYFEFFGGEPLLYSRIESAIRLIRDAGCVLAIPTNGVLIEPLAEMLVDTEPSRLWVSLDGPEALNDAQRGAGVFRNAVRGMERLADLRDANGQSSPELGVTFVVTPQNHLHIEEFFLESIELTSLAHVSIEFQNYATREEVDRYAELMRTELSIESTPCAEGYLSDPASFATIDTAAVAEQMVAVRARCRDLGTSFYSHPRTLEAANFRSYFAARWDEMKDHRSRCAFPWIYAEISARGEVTPCHSFYDHSVGNVHEQSLHEIWHGARLAKLRRLLRRELLPICTACCRYYNNPSSSLRGS